MFAILNFLNDYEWNESIGTKWIIAILSLSSLLWRPTQLYLRGRRGEPKNEALLFQSTVDIHFQNAHKTLFQSTVDIHFQNAHKTHKKLRGLALCAFIYLRFSTRHENTKPQNIATKRCRGYDHIIGIDKISTTWSPCPNIESTRSRHGTPCPHIVPQMYD